MIPRHVRARLALLVLGMLLVASACASRSSTSTGSSPAGAVAAFAEAFDAGVGHRRLVLLMSPT